MSAESEGSAVRVEMNPLLPEAGSTREEGQSHNEESWKPADFKKRECNTFIEDSSSDGKCQCGRPKDKHPRHINTAVDTEWTSAEHSSELPTDAFGGLEFEGKTWIRSKYFLRLSSDTKPSVVYDLMTRDKGQDDGWYWRTPDMVVSVVGGEGSAEVKPWVQKVIRQGLVKGGETPGGESWILTEGFDDGIGRCVGEACRDSDNFRVHAFGITPWGLVHNRHQLVVSQGKAYDCRNHAQYSVEKTTSDSCCLEKNHFAFLLVDDGSEGHKGGEKNFRVKLEEHFSTQYIRDSSSINISVLNMLISGETTMLERVDKSLENSAPWLVLAGSGGVADLLSDILENQSLASDGVDVDRVKERIRKYFPSEARTEQLVDQVKSIYQNRNLITFYHEKDERPEDFGTVIIKALMPASKHRAGNTFPYGKELRLAMRWNKVDFASSELFNDDININWTDEALKDCMMFALLNDKTQFVRLFIEKKFNIKTYLTYGLLEELYSRVDKDTPFEHTLVYNLLLERLKKRLGTPDLSSPDPRPFLSLEEISLFEVSGVLKKLMGDVKPFNFTDLGLEDFTSGQKALEFFIVLKEERSYRNKPCESPWTHLFILAVLQNHSDWAVFFWEMAEEDSVLNALSACKMLREMSKLESKTDTKLSMKELAQKFENRAHGMLISCYESNENDSFEVLKRESPVWNTNCFKMGVALESHLFFDHDGLESMLSQAWWGDMKKDTTKGKVLLTLFCPLLICTNLISSREPDSKPKPSFVSRWYQFWNAPVTSFLGNAVMYFPFLFLFAYVLLVDFKPPPPSGPSISEYVLYFWVFTFLCEEIYEVFFMRDLTSRERMTLYMQDVWNMYDLTAILLFIIGLICRMFKQSVGRCVLSIDYMVFTLRLIHIFAVQKQMGPKIIMVGKMMKDIFSFLFFLGVWIVAYGVANQALLYSYDPKPDRIFRRVFYIPYLRIFGHFDTEGVHAAKADNCTDNVTQIEGGVEPCRSVDNNWLVIILLVVFLLVTNIMLLNLLIAILTNTIETVQDKSDLYWKFQYYNLIMEYQSRPVLAPPFIFLSHLHLFFSFLKKKIHGTPNRDQSPRELSRVLRVKIWENRQKKKFLKAQSETERSSDSERIKHISDKVDRMEKQLTEQHVSLETKVENALSQILDALAKAPWTKPPST